MNLEMPFSLIQFKFQTVFLCVTNESNAFSPSDSNFGHGNSSHSAQTSRSFFFTQQVIKGQEGCLLKKSGGHNSQGILNYLRCSIVDTSHNRVHSSQELDSVLSGVRSSYFSAPLLILGDKLRLFVTAQP